MDLHTTCVEKKSYRLVARKLTIPSLNTFTPVGSQCNNRTCRQLLGEFLNRCPSCGAAGLQPIYNFYQVLQVSPSVAPEELRSQYKKLSLQYHPDVRFGNPEDFLIIKQAYEELQHPQQRQEHDTCLYQLQQIRNGCFGSKPRASVHIFWEEVPPPIYEEIRRIQRMRHTCGILGGILGICCSILLEGSLLLYCVMGYVLGSFYPQMGKLLLLLCNILVFLITVRFSLIALQTKSLFWLPVILWITHWYIKSVPNWEKELE